MKKVLPLTLVLIGAALLITAVVFWIDSSTSTQPDSFGKSLRDWITLILGIGASLKGWMDLFKKEKPTPPTTKIDVKGEKSQISLGDNSPNIQTDTYISTQIIQQPQEPKTPKSLNQLPAPPLDFIGREKELAQLHRNIEKGVLISGVQGMGGIGKTALGLKLAEQIVPNYPDGQIYLDLRGAHEQTSLKPEQVMTHVIHSFHPEAALPINFNELGAMYRSVLGGKRVLLFYDNVRDENQLKDLIPPRSCVLFVTSRQFFTLPGLAAIDLETLTPTDSMALVQEIASKVSETDAKTLANQCGYLPLAIRAAVSVLRLRPDWSPAELIRRLNDNRARLGLVESSLSLSYDALDTDLQEYLRQLGVFAAPFDKEAILAVWFDKKDSRLQQLELALLSPSDEIVTKETPEQDVDDILGELLKTSLLKYDQNTNEYYFHDLTHIYLEEKLRKDDVAVVTLQRYGKHYLALANQTSADCNKGGDITKFALMNFQKCWIHLSVISERLSNDAKSTWILPNSADYWLAESFNQTRFVLSKRYSHKDYLPFAIRALNAVKRLKNRELEDSYLDSLGSIYYGLGDLKQAIACYEQGLEIDRQIGNRSWEIRGLHNIGRIYETQGDAKRALEFFEQALLIAREINDRGGEAIVLGSIGSAYATLGLEDRAVEYYENALTLAREINDKDVESMLMGIIGFIKQTGDLDSSLVMSQNIGSKRQEALLLSAVAGKKRGEGNLQESLLLHEQAMKIYNEIGDIYIGAQTLDNMANTYADLGEYEKAFENYESAMRFAETVGDDELIANIAWNIATIYNEKQQYELAAKYMQITVDFERKINHANANADLEKLNEVRNKIQNTPKPEEES